MQRYFVENEQVDHDLITIMGDDVHHIVHVMRMKENDSLICCLPNGQACLCRIQQLSSQFVRCQVISYEEKTHELPIHVTIVQGLPKSEKLEWVIQKGTELGAYEFIPFLAKRSIVKWDDKKAAKKRERYEKIAKEAAEQSYRNHVPIVAEPKTLKEIVEIGKTFDVKLIAYEEVAKEGELRMLKQSLCSLKAGGSLMAVIGPEGGLTEEEVTFLEENGFIACSFGPRILRTETAPLYLLSAVSYHFEMLG